MPLFKIEERKISHVPLTNFNLEKELQTLIEKNLEDIFSCHFIASEFSTGAEHAGRIDTLALSEDKNPVIIEYKKEESSSLLNQSLFYLSWIKDHKGDFEIAVQKKLGSDIIIDWSSIRVICIAPDFKKYDLHAAKVMAANIELWKYRLYTNQTISFDVVYQHVDPSDSKKHIKTIGDSKRDGEVKDYSFEGHIEGKSEKIVEITKCIQEYILGLDDNFIEIPRKNYLAYKISQNIVCMEIHKNEVLLFLKLNYTDVDNPPSNARDVSNIGHFGTGNFELRIKSKDNMESVKSLIYLAYQKVGG